MIAAPITMIPVESSQITHIGHDTATNTMAVKFKGYGGKDGSTYHYEGVTPEQFDAFLKAESIGSHFGKNFKSNAAHPYRKIEGAHG